MDGRNWRGELHQKSRLQVITMIINTLMEHVAPFAPHKESEVEQLALKFEHKIFLTAASKKEYLHLICSRMHLVETMAQKTELKSLPPNEGSISYQPLSHEIEQSLSNGLAIKSQPYMKILSQSDEKKIVSAEAQTSALSTTMRPQCVMLHGINETLNLHTTSGNSQNSIGNLVGQRLPSNNFTNSQRQMQGRQQSLQVFPQPNQQQSQKSQHHSSKQQFQHQLWSHNFKQGNITQCVIQTVQQGQHQQSILPLTQLQASQRSLLQMSHGIQPSMIQSVPSSFSLSRNQHFSAQESTQSILQQHAQSILGQQQHQRTPLLQQPIFPPGRQQQLMGQLPIAKNIKQDQLNGEQNSVSDMQHQQKLLGQNYHLKTHLQQLGRENNVSKVCTQSDDPTMLNDHRSIHGRQQAGVEVLQTVSSLLPTKGKQSQTQPSEKQLKPVILSQPAKLQQDLQQRLETSASPPLQHSSLMMDQNNLLTSLTKSGNSLQSPTSPSIAPSPSNPLIPSPVKRDAEKPIFVVSRNTNSGNIGHLQTTGVLMPDMSIGISTLGLSFPPLLGASIDLDTSHNILTVDFDQSSVSGRPLQRLIKVVKSMSHQALSASVNDIESVLSVVERTAGSIPGKGSRCAVGEDLVAMNNCYLQVGNYVNSDGITGALEMRRYVSAMPLIVVSSAGSISDSLNQMTDSEISDLESTISSRTKRPRVEEQYSLLKEIWEINQKLIDTVVYISHESINSAAASSVTQGGEGTIVMCSFNAVAVSPNMGSNNDSSPISLILPLRVFVPTNYPNCSPILLDKFPAESREYEDLSVKANSKLHASLCNLLQPMLLGEIVRTWDVCARTVVSEYAQQNGGGNFSSRYGNWENCLSID